MFKTKTAGQAERDSGQQLPAECLVNQNCSTTQ